jgi:predicted amidohydrolase
MFRSMRIALVQTNPTVGDLVGNAKLVAAAIDEARHRGAELVVFSELVISGYPPKDLLLREGWCPDRASHDARAPPRSGRQCVQPARRRPGRRDGP